MIIHIYNKLEAILIKVKKKMIFTNSYPSLFTCFLENFVVVFLDYTNRKYNNFIFYL